MPNILTVVTQFRAALLARDRAAASAMIDAYGRAFLRIRAALDRITVEIVAARSRGEEVPPSFLFEQQRLQTLQRQVEAEIREFARFAEATILQEQRIAVEAAQSHAEQLTLAALGPAPPTVRVQFVRLPSEALTDLVGTLTDGSPLRRLLDELGPDASRAVRDTLINGVVLGQGPRQIAREMRQALGGNLVRALRIARTETLRSYRTATLRSYQANDDIVRGWRWVASLSARTCPACLAMHGTFHRLDEPFSSHPNCRCVAVPATRSWAELGFAGIPDARPRIESGADWFARQDEETQLRILGPAKLAAYKSGQIELRDLVQRTRSREWGPGRQEASLRVALENARRRRDAA